MLLDNSLAVLEVGVTQGRVTHGGRGMVKLICDLMCVVEAWLGAGHTSIVCRRVVFCVHAPCSDSRAFPSLPCLASYPAGNTLKYIKMAASSNFGNIFSVLVASACIPFQPMAPIQLLTQVGAAAF